MTRFSGVALATVAMLVLFSATAQADGLPGWFGAKGGVSMAYLGGEDAGLDPGFAPGVAAGVFVAQMVYPHIVLEVDCLFLQKGGTGTGHGLFNGNLDKGDQTTSINALEFPVLIRITDQIWGPLGASLILGTSASFVLSGKRKTEFQLQGTVEEDIDRLISFDLGLIAGVSVEWGPIFLEGLYDWGVRFIDSTDGEDVNELQAHTLAIMAGFRKQF